MRYVRDWRLHLGSVALSTTAKTIGAVAHAIGYESAAAFNRAFSRVYGIPPATWRQNARRGLNAGEGALS
jgi:AraC-like DNA-binding protein